MKVLRWVLIVIIGLLLLPAILAWRVIDLTLSIGEAVVDAVFPLS